MSQNFERIRVRAHNTRLGWFVTRQQAGRQNDRGQELGRIVEDHVYGVLGLIGIDVVRRALGAPDLETAHARRLSTEHTLALDVGDEHEADRQTIKTNDHHNKHGRAVVVVDGECFGVGRLVSTTTTVVVAVLMMARVVMAVARSVMVFVLNVLVRIVHLLLLECFQISRWRLYFVYSRGFRRLDSALFYFLVAHAVDAGRIRTGRLFAK